MNKIIVFLTGLLFGATGMAQEQIDFRVSIPDTWRLESHSLDEGLWAYESEDGKHRLTVSILYYSKEPTHAKQREYLDDFIKVRKKQSSQMASDLKYTDIVTTEFSGAWVAKYEEESSGGRVATTKVISSKIGIANFYFESISSKKAHKELSEKILATTGFAS